MTDAFVGYLQEGKKVSSNGEKVKVEVMMSSRFEPNENRDRDQKDEGKRKKLIVA